MPNRGSERGRACVIYTVPGELIGKIFLCLLPELQDTGVLRYPFNQGDLSDICSCRLVSNLFYEIASPLFWRRIRLSLPGAKNTMAFSALNSTHLSRLSQLSSHIINHKEIQVSMRLLTLVSGGPVCEADVARKAMSVLSSLVPLLMNMRVLCLHNIPPLPSKLLIKVLMCPSLLTVRIGGLDCSGLQLDRGMVNANIQKVGIHRCKRVERLYPLMPSVKVFDSAMDDVPSFIPLWNNLQEASFQADLPAWDRATGQFLAWRHARRNIPLTLTELMICQWRFNPKIRDVDSIVVPFIGHPLKVFILFYIEQPTAVSLEAVVRAFPGLRELTLLSDEELSYWPDPLDVYGDVLGRLRELRLLEWNYYDGDDDVNVYGSWDMVDKDRMAEIALTLADSCINLIKVNFCLVVDGVMHLSIVREESGQAHESAAEYSEHAIHCTSSWKKDQFTDI